MRTIRLRGERFSLLRSFSFKGLASGSESARRSTSASESLSCAFQSVLPLGRCLRSCLTVAMVFLSFFPGCPPCCDEPHSVLSSRVGDEDDAAVNFSYRAISILFSIFPIIKPLKALLVVKEQ